jgi:AraC-like DNA-binding protein
MFSMRYFSPAQPLRPLLSSYYVVEFGAEGLADVMRAELANVRFLLSGRSWLTWPGGDVRGGLPASVFGPRCVPIGLRCEGPGRIFGAGIMPMGWAALFGVASDELADAMLPLDALAGSLADATLTRMLESTSDAGLVAAADEFFLTLARLRPAAPNGFGPLVEDWLVGGSHGGVDELVARAELSSRQVERLCRRLYGAPPKLLLRKYRALRAAVHYSVDPGACWMDVAGEDFYDQPHFIREFKTFVGMTPTQFAAQGAAVMNHSIRLRRALPTLPRLSLVS